MGMLLDNWYLTNNLVWSLMEIASRRRLAVIIPTLDISQPILIQSFFTFADTCEHIEQWAIVYKECVRKFGLPNSAQELKAAFCKTVKTKKANTPYISGVLVNKPRFYNLGRLLPIRLDEVFSANRVIEGEFSQNICASPDNKSMCNIDLLRLSFPSSFVYGYNNASWSRLFPSWVILWRSGLRAWI